MIVHNEVKMHGELAYNTDNRTVSYKHCTGRTLVHIIPDSRGETHLTSLRN